MSVLKYSCMGGEELRRGTSQSAGLDLTSTAHIHIPCGHAVIVKTSVVVEIPQGYVGLVRGRSGLAFKEGVIAFEGTVDSDYRGTINIMLFATWQDYDVRPGDRIAQLVIVPSPILELERVSTKSHRFTGRGDSGLGSTGK